jgi:hypothetical protein
MGFYDSMAGPMRSRRGCNCFADQNVLFLRSRIICASPNRNPPALVEKQADSGAMTREPFDTPLGRKRDAGHFFCWPLRQSAMFQSRFERQPAPVENIRQNVT